MGGGKMRTPYCKKKNCEPKGTDLDRCAGKQCPELVWVCRLDAKVVSNESSLVQ